MQPFTIVELIVHKKYNMKGRDSKVGKLMAEFEHIMCIMC